MLLIVDNPDADGEMSCTRVIIGRIWFTDWQMPRGWSSTDSAALRSWYGKVVSLYYLLFNTHYLYNFSVVLFLCRMHTGYLCVDKNSLYSITHWLRVHYFVLFVTKRIAIWSFISSDTKSTDLTACICVLWIAVLDSFYHVLYYCLRLVGRTTYNNNWSNFFGFVLLLSHIRPPS